MIFADTSRTVLTGTVKLGSRKLGRACTVSAASGKALTQGTVGSTATTITVTDGSNVCTITSASGCNAAVDTDEAFTTSGSCTYAINATLNFSATGGDCTVGPSFYDIVVDCTP
jgi:hypothetical protein